MVVFSLTDCPPKVRGDLSKWLLEISPNVFVGNLNKRVREKLWERVCRNMDRGRVTMVYSQNGPQGLGFEVFGSTWEPVDFDGITLIRKPLPKTTSSQIDAGYSRASKIQKAKKFNQSKKVCEEFIVLDLETTGLDSSKNEILEVGALLVVDGEVIEEYSALILTLKEIDNEILNLTGLTQEQIEQEGKQLREVLPELKDFIGKRKIIGHNIFFDLKFLTKAFAKENIPFSIKNVEDTLKIAKRQCIETKDKKYDLVSLAEHFGIKYNAHRALEDCRATFEVYMHLKKK